MKENSMPMPNVEGARPPIEAEPGRPSAEEIQTTINGYLGMRTEAQERGTLDVFEGSTMRDLRRWSDEDGWDSLDREMVFPGWTAEDIREIVEALDAP